MSGDGGVRKLLRPLMDGPAIAGAAGVAGAAGAFGLPPWLLALSQAALVVVWTTRAVERKLEANESVNVAQDARIAELQARLVALAAAQAGATEAKLLALAELQARLAPMVEPDLPHVEPPPKKESGT